MNSKVQQTLNLVLEKFESGDIPEAVAYSMFPLPDVPSARWSLLNRTLMFLNGTMDARGIRQWNRANRFVKKGTKAFYILVPYIKSVEDEGDDQQVLVGFGLKPVFRVEDTDGEPLEYETIELPTFPLIDRAKSWGIDVKAIPGDYRYFGYYLPGEKKISLASAEECVFFHELAHCAHEIVLGGLQIGQNPLQEIVAELASHCLCRMVGKTGDRNLGNSYRYVERYAKEIKLTPHQACIKVLRDVEKVLALVLNGRQEDEDNLYKAVA